ncbi:MAG: hypothetical protein ABI992_02020 [Chthoniobacterales bacterium]
MRKKWWGIIIGLGLVGALGAIFFAQHFLARTLESEKTRNRIAARIGRVIDGEVGVLPITAHGFSVSSSGLVGMAAPPRALTEARATRVSARFDLMELWRGKLRVDRLTVAHAQAAFSPAAARLLDRTEFPSPPLIPAAKEATLMSVDIRHVAIDRTDLFFADPAKDGGAFRGVETHFYPKGENLVIHGQGGTFHQAKFPEARITSFKAFYEKPNLRVDEAHLALGEHGQIDVIGGFRFEGAPSLDLRFAFARCPIASFLPAGDKLTGTFNGDTHLEKNGGKGAEIKASGALQMKDAVVQNVVALERAATFTGERRLNPLRLDDIHGQYEWADERLVVRDLRAEANHVVCLQGGFTYRREEIAGTFELGVSPEIVAKFPGAREEVFTREHGGYLWTTVKIDGPPGHLHDDLKPRLLHAIEKHFLGGILSPLVKPAKAAREVIELFLPEQN